MFKHCSYAVAILLTVCTLVLCPAPPAQALTLTDMQAQFSMSTNPDGNRVINLLVNSALFGTAGIASGILYPPNPIFPPNPIIWTAEPFFPEPGPPDDFTTGLSFIINSADEVSGVEPTPFRWFVASAVDGEPVSVFGNYLELDFRNVSGSLGSLVLAGVLLWEVDSSGVRTDTFYELDTFTIQPVPIPAALPLLASALGLFGFFGWRRRKAVAA